MLSKAKIKLIQSLSNKKQREITGLFPVEGNKTVIELIRSKIVLKSLFATPEWLLAHEVLLTNVEEVVEVSEKELAKISAMVTPQDVVALCYLPTAEPLPDLTTDMIIALDTIQDPGNMGTIIRIADWYGIKHIVCSEACVDVYNPKVIQATMGSFMRVNCVKMDLNILLSKQQVPVYGAVMNGHSLYETPFTPHGIILIGNEGAGIHPSLHQSITHHITIPRRGEAESLNAGIATAIICDAWARSLR